MRKLTLEHKRKIGEASKRLWATPEHRNKMSNKLRGRKFTEEHKKRISEARKGYRHTKEAKEKMSKWRQENREHLSNKRKQYFQAVGTDFLRGENNPNWRGGKSMNGPYITIYMPKHPRAEVRGHVREHYLVWENFWGDIVSPGYEIHHIDHNPKNNDITNLTLMTVHNHSVLHSNKRKRNSKGQYA